MSGNNGNDSGAVPSRTSSNKDQNNVGPFRNMAVVSLQNTSAPARSTATILRTNQGQILLVGNTGNLPFVQSNVALPVQINNLNLSSIQTSSTAVPPDPLPSSISTLRHPTPPPPAPGPVSVQYAATAVQPAPSASSSPSRNGYETPVAIQLPGGPVAHVVGPTVVLNRSIPVGHTLQQSSAQGQTDAVQGAAEKKCIQFLRALLHSAKEKDHGTLATQVADAVGCLLGNRITPQAFTEKAQDLLQSKPQPSLLPFLERTLPAVRTAFFAGDFILDGVDPRLYFTPLVAVASTKPLLIPRSQVTTTVMSSAPIAGPYIVATPTGYLRPNVVSGRPAFNNGTPKQQYPALAQQLNLSRRPSEMIANDNESNDLRPSQHPKSPTKSTNKPKPSMSKKNATSGSFGISGKNITLTGSPKSSKMNVKEFVSSGNANQHQGPSSPERYRDHDDDINDVATMGGVNLSEESQQILASTTELLSVETRSCGQEGEFLSSTLLASKFQLALSSHRISNVVTPEILELVSLATRERLKQILERLSILAEHRTEPLRINPLFEQISDVRVQLRFLDELAQTDLKKKGEREKSLLYKMAKSRSSKLGDEEQQRMKELAKELQKAEQEEMQSRNANVAAMMALSSSRKRPAPGASKSNVSANALKDGNSSTSAASLGQVSRPRFKRVTMKDLQFLRYQDQQCRTSKSFYLSFFK